MASFSHFPTPLRPSLPSPSQVRLRAKKHRQDPLPAADITTSPGAPPPPHARTGTAGSAQPGTQVEDGGREGTLGAGEGDGEVAMPLPFRHSGSGGGVEGTPGEFNGSVLQGAVEGGGALHGGGAGGEAIQGEELQARAFVTVEELVSGKLPAADMAAHKLFQVSGEADRQLSCELSVEGQTS